MRIAGRRAGAAAAGAWTGAAAVLLFACRAGAVDLPVQRHVLSNGLTVLLLENHESPTLGLCTAFRVGSGDEWDGITGSTHILEHMLFKGTDRMGTTDWKREKKLHDRIEALAQEIKALSHAHPREADPARLESLRAEFAAAEAEAKKFVVANELWETYQNAGGVNMNADTGPDITRYYLALPANQLEPWLYLESSRLRSPVLREFYTEKKNVMEERRLGIDTQPDGVLWEELAAAAFRAHRYGTLTIGHASDIETVTRTEVEAFFRSYYAPNRMVIAIAGDMDPAKTLELVKAYFGDIPRQPAPEPVETVEPPQEGERRVEREFDAEPQVYIGYHRPAGSHPDDPVYTVITRILNGGRSSRFNKEIVEDQQVAVSVNIDPYGVGEKDATLYTIMGVPRAPHTTAEVEAAIYHQLERLKSEPVGARELEKAKNQIEADFVRRLESNFGMALELASAEATYDDWEILLREREAVRRVTAEDVARVAGETFRRKNRTVATLVPLGGEEMPLSAEAKSQAEAVLARALEALGGEKALAGVRDLTVKSKIAISAPGGMNLEATASSATLLPDRFRSEFTLMGMTQVQGSDGATWWAQAGGQVQDLPADQVRDARASFVRERLFFLLAAARDAFRVEPVKGESPEVETLRFSTADGVKFTMSFERGSGLPAWARFDTTHPMTRQSARGEELYADYRKAGGVLLPHTVTLKLNDEKFVTQTVTSVETNKGMQAGAFARPSS